MIHSPYEKPSIWTPLLVKQGGLEGSFFSSWVCLKKFKTNCLQIEFLIEKPSWYQWKSSEHWSIDGARNWGIWEEDVVEFFLQIRKTSQDSMAPYLEFISNPVAKNFSLITYRPRQIIATPLKQYFHVKTQQQGNFWHSQLSVESIFEGSSGQLWGDCHVCLGPSNQRENDLSKQRVYFSLFDQKDVIDFHRPELFGNLEEVFYDPR